MKRFCISLAVMFFGSYCFAKWRMNVQKNEVLEKTIDEVNKFREFYGILNYWLTLKDEHKTLECYFTENGYHNIAIYGMKDLGIHLYEELKNTRVNVLYGIDKNADCIYAEIEVYKPGYKMPDVDVIIVTAVHYFDEIKRELQQYTNAPIISLADVMNEV